MFDHDANEFGFKCAPYRAPRAPYRAPSMTARTKFVIFCIVVASLAPVLILANFLKG